MLKINKSSPFILSAAIMLILTGCGGAGSSSADSSVTQTETASVTTQASEQETEKETETETQETERTYRDIINGMDIKETWKQELIYSNEEKGFNLEKIEQDTISCADYVQMLTEFIQDNAPEKSDDWAEHCKGLRNSDEPIRRIDAMAALFLAGQTIGGDYFTQNNWTFYLYEENCFNQKWDESYGVTGDYFSDDEKNDQFAACFGYSGLDWAAFYYNCSRPSPYSGEYPFALDEVSDSFLMEKNPTYAEALMSVMRLYASSHPDEYIYVPTEVDEPYLEMAARRRNEIQCDQTDLITDAKGTVYYVSNNGDDANDGKSPETAWATPYKAMAEKLQPGDTVLFERKGVWYTDAEKNLGDAGRNLMFGDGVNVGAYGEGDKPLFRGDIERANDPGFWEIYYDKDGVRIWKAAEELRRTTVIIFNYGETQAEEIMAWWDGDKAYVNEDKSPFIVEEALKQDRTFCHLLDLEKYHDRMSNPDYTERGTLYLRCDEGNPAEIYDTVSIPQEITGFDITPHSIFCDLDIRYYVMMAAHCTGGNNSPNQEDQIDYKIHDLEISWCGGFYSTYDGHASGLYQPHIAGGALGIYASDVEVTGCLFYQCGPMTMILSMHDHTPETPDKFEYKNLYYADNLYEYCAAPLHWVDFTPGENEGSLSYIKDLTFENNIVMYSGDGIFYNRIKGSSWDFGTGNSYWLSAIENGMGAADNDGITIRNNVLYQSRYALITLNEKVGGPHGRPVNNKTRFEGNTYVQISTRPLIQEHHSVGICYPSDEAVKNVLGDKDGKCVICQPTPLVE